LIQELFSPFLIPTVIIIFEIFYREFKKYNKTPFVFANGLVFFCVRWGKMLKRTSNNNGCLWLKYVVRHYSRIRPPRSVSVDKVIRVSNNIARLDVPKEGPKPRQLLSLPPFPCHPLPGKNTISAHEQSDRVTAVNWIKYYFKGVSGSVIESHFREGLVSIYYFLVFAFFCSFAVSN
jgi:hypothetical protein